eukprot:10801908-Lingulodinium_polyedra.AAC.1
MQIGLSLETPPALSTSRRVGCCWGGCTVKPANNASANQLRVSRHGAPTTAMRRSYAHTRAWGG